MNQQKLAGQTAIVTGSSSGIGQGIAIALAKEGANVVINYHSDQDGAEATQKAIQEANVKSIIVQANVGDEKDVLKMFDVAQKEFGGIDILVNNSGVESDKRLTEMTLEDWEKVMNINVTGYFLCAREAARVFIKQGLKNISKAAGKMIFTSSVHDRIPWAGHSNYVASKGAVKMFMESIAQELAPQKIRVNSISPGAIRTPINKAAWGTPEGMRDLLEKIPYQRIGEVEDIGKLAVFLASDDSDYITGTTIYCDGGMTLYPDFQHGG